MLDLLEDVSQVTFYKSDKQLEEVGLESEQPLSIFAEDERGYYAFLGNGTGHSHQQPVAYLHRGGSAGVVAPNLREFLKLLTYYSFWLELVGLTWAEFSKEGKALEKACKAQFEEYEEEQKELADSLSLEKDEFLLKKIYDTMANSAPLTVGKMGDSEHFSPL